MPTRLCALLVLTLGLTLMIACHGWPAAKEEKIVATPEMLKTGKTIFRENCARCHRPGENPEAPNLMKVKFLPASKIRSMVRNGDEEEMPAFSTTEISDEELTAVVAHLQNARERYKQRQAKGEKAGQPEGKDSDATGKVKKAQPSKSKPDAS